MRINLSNSSNHTLSVGLGERSYEIVIGSNLILQLESLLKPVLKRQRVFIVTEENVAKAHLAKLKHALEKAQIECEALILSAGEQTKSFANLEHVLSTLLDWSAERQDTLIALGGGVIGDLTGLAAGLMKRGCPFIQIPTTLLAQVDSSVGGKTAINAPQGKNLIGLFNQPCLVLADLNLLKTLPEREFKAGLAEVIKYGLLGDYDFFEFVEAHADELLAQDKKSLIKAIYTSCHAKARIVEEDERETGKRALLNFGHTFAHALERANNYESNLLHGEAVAVGMAMALRFSAENDLMDESEAHRAISAISSLGLATDVKGLVGLTFIADELLDHMYHDKKAADGDIQLILARAIGETYQTKWTNSERLLDFLKRECA